MTRRTSWGGMRGACRVWAPAQAMTAITLGGHLRLPPPGAQGQPQKPLDLHTHVHTLSRTTCPRQSPPGAKMLGLLNDSPPAGMHFLEQVTTGSPGGGPKSGRDEKAQVLTCAASPHWDPAVTVDREPQFQSPTGLSSNLSTDLKLKPLPL